LVEPELELASSPEYASQEAAVVVDTYVYRRAFGTAEQALRQLPPRLIAAAAEPMDKDDKCRGRAIPVHLLVEVKPP
jgi:hypothetical protein